MDQDSLDPTTATRLVRTIDRRLDSNQRVALLSWAERMLEIRNGDLPARKKAKEALLTTYRAEVILPVMKSLGATLGDVIWKDRSLSGRLGIAGAGAAVLAFGSQGAGIAALGGAIGVPLWVVFGAGGMFAGQIITELQRSLRRPPAARIEPADDEVIIEADWTIDDPDRPLSVTASSGSGQDKPASERLWRTLRRAYREARERQRSEGEE